MKKLENNQFSLLFQRITSTLKTKKRLIIVLVTTMALVFIATLVAQNNQRKYEQGQLDHTNTTSADEDQPGSSESARPSKLSEVTANPSSFTKTEITVIGRIETVMPGRIFRLTDPETSARVYILTPRDLSEDEANKTKDLLDGTNSAEVTGTLRTFNEADLKNSFDITLPDNLKPLFNVKRLFIITKSVTVSR